MGGGCNKKVKVAHKSQLIIMEVTPAPQTVTGTEAAAGNDPVGEEIVTTQSLPVPRSVVGHIIGRGGANIKKTQEKSSLRGHRSDSGGRCAFWLRSGCVSAAFSLCDSSPRSPRPPESREKNFLPRNFPFTRYSLRQAHLTDTLMRLFSCP